MYIGHVFVALCVLYVCCNGESYCAKDQLCEFSHLKNRYLFYDVNPPEGFNLRRDVYLRFAIFVHALKKSSEESLNNFKLVLPPWTNIYHWRAHANEFVPWSHFFDLESLQKFAPVMELYQFFQEIGRKYTVIKIDEVFILQQFEDMFKSGKFEDKTSIEACNKPNQITFFYHSNISSDNIKCLSFHGHTSQLSTILKNSDAKTVLIDHAEVALHDRFGDHVYWQARRSMRFNNELIAAAARFRKTYLNSNDESDGTMRPIDWRDEMPGSSAIGGPYLSVHLRRRDFVWGRPTEVPSITSAAKHITKLLVKLGLNKVFVATDANDEDYNDLVTELKDFEVYRFLRDENIEENYNEGQVAIIDQIICSHAKYFVGTHESTFSFRIQEEREIMGFASETTFNRFCGSNKKCEKPSIWKIMY